MRAIRACCNSYVKPISMEKMEEWWAFCKDKGIDLAQGRHVSLLANKEEAVVLKRRRLGSMWKGKAALRKVRCL